MHALLAVGGLWQTRKKLYRAWPGGQLRMVLPRFNLRNNDVTSEELLEVLDLVDSDFARMMDGWRRYVQRRKHEFWDNWDKTYGKTAVLAWGSLTHSLSLSGSLSLSISLRESQLGNVSRYSVVQA